MSDTKVTPTPADVAPQQRDGDQPDAQPETPNPAETVEFWKQKAREQEKRAKDNADAAKRLAALEDAQKSEAEKVADALAQARSEADTSRAELLRYRTAATHGITDPEDIELFLTGRDEETLTRQATALAARNAANASPRPPRPNPAQREGDSPVDDKDATARAFFGIS
jgi:hypothetical protein